MKKYKLKLDIYELKIIINSLNEFRNKLIKENENTDVKVETLVLLVYNIFEFLSDEHYS